MRSCVPFPDVPSGRPTKCVLGGSGASLAVPRRQCRGSWSASRLGGALTLAVAAALLLLVLAESAAGLMVPSTTTAPVGGVEPFNATATAVAGVPQRGRAADNVGAVANNLTVQMDLDVAAQAQRSLLDTVPRFLRGRYGPRLPQKLPGLRVQRKLFSPEQLRALYGNMTVVYTFVNGSEANHVYRKRMIMECQRSISFRESSWYMNPEVYYGVSANASVVRDDQGSYLEELEAWQANYCLPRMLQMRRLRKLGDPWRLTRYAANGAGDYRDREVDELRHSLRSVEQHISWHRGRVVIVSPGHHPGWVDGAKNFLAGRCGGSEVVAMAASGTHLRITTVHQDSILPYGMRLTRNSHTVEQRLWRVKNLTAIHLYFNDDYFVNRDLRITNVLNPRGGPIIRTEKDFLGDGKVGDDGFDWRTGVLHSHLFTIVELDERPEDYLPDDLFAMWKDTQRWKKSTLTLPAPDNERNIETAFHYKGESLPSGPIADVRNRRYATHAPFVYCTNMFRYLETRYEREFAHNVWHHRRRTARDLYLPFLYNAFAMERPWVASPKFLPYLLKRKEGKSGAGVTIALDNFDGCGRASYRSGREKSGCVFVKIVDDLERNERRLARLVRQNPLYFNLNADYTLTEAADQLHDFIANKFSTPIYLERGLEPVSDADRALPDVYAGLMGLPVIAVTSFAEGVCPMVRSLQLALPDHSGIVISAVARHGTDGDDAAADKTLSALRAEMLHRVRNAVPVSACAYNERVRPLRVAAPVPASREAALSDDTLLRIVRTALEEAGSAASAAVALPDVCGYEGASRIRAIVLDGRTDVRDAMSLRHAVTMPGQSLALEDFEVVPVGDGSGDSVLVLSRQAADAKSVHWIDGAAESDLLLTYPIAYALYEDLEARLVWSNEEE